MPIYVSPPFTGGFIDVRFAIFHHEHSLTSSVATFTFFRYVSKCHRSTLHVASTWLLLSATFWNAAFANFPDAIPYDAIAFTPTPSPTTLAPASPTPFMAPQGSQKE